MKNKPRVIAWCALVVLLLGIIKFSGFIAQRSYDGHPLWDEISGAWIGQIIFFIGFVFSGALLARASAIGQIGKPNKTKLSVGIVMLLFGVIWVLRYWATIYAPNLLNFLNPIHFFIFGIPTSEHILIVVYMIYVMGGFLTVNSFYSNEE